MWRRKRRSPFLRPQIYSPQATSETALKYVTAIEKGVVLKPLKRFDP